MKEDRKGEREREKRFVLGLIDKDTRIFSLFFFASYLRAKKKKRLGCMIRWVCFNVGKWVTRYEILVVHGRAKFAKKPPHIVEREIM